MMVAWSCARRSHRPDASVGVRNLVTTSAVGWGIWVFSWLAGSTTGERVGQEPPAAPRTGADPGGGKAKEHVFANHTRRHTALAAWAERHAEGHTPHTAWRPSVPTLLRRGQT